MLSPEDRDEIRTEVYRDLIEIERRITQHAGSYSYLCLIDGEPVFTHTPVGAVLRAITRIPHSVAC